MSNPKQALPSGANAGGEWDEAKLEAALKNLKELHIKMRELRSTIPRIHERLGNSKVTEATRAAMNEIEEYKKLATNSENARILEHAQQSRKNNPKGIKPWRSNDEPDWLEPST